MQTELIWKSIPFAFGFRAFFEDKPFFRYHYQDFVNKDFGDHKWFWATLSNEVPLMSSGYTTEEACKAMAEHILERLLIYRSSNKPTSVGSVIERPIEESPGHYTLSIINTDEPKDPIIGKGIDRVFRWDKEQKKPFEVTREQLEKLLSLPERGEGYTQKMVKALNI